MMPTRAFFVCISVASLLGGCLIFDDGPNDDGECFGGCCDDEAPGCQGGSDTVGGGGQGGTGGVGGSGGAGGEAGCDPSLVVCACEDASNCAEGLACLDGDCIEVCIFDFECADGEVCADGACVPSCNTECALGEVCVAGACLPSETPECVTGADCESGVCVNGACTSACETHADCPEDELCQASSGTCITDTSPTPSCSEELPCTGEGQTCIDGTCRYECEALTECKLIDSRFDACDAGLCKTQEEVAPECTFDSPCASGAPCISNACAD